MVELIIVGIFGLFLALLTYKKELLSAGGSASVFAMLVLIDVFGKWKMVVLIVWAYLTLSLIDKVFARKIEKSVAGVHEKSGKRMASQVWVNGGAAIISILLFGITGRISFLMAYIIAIGEAYADSLASDVGVMSSKSPIDICTFKPITNGLSGGVSALGSSASLCGVIIYAILAKMMTGITLSSSIMMVVVIMGGCLLDSILGSKVQIKYRCPICGDITEKKKHCGDDTKTYSGISWIDNSMVNLISNIITCVVGVLIVELFQFT